MAILLLIVLLFGIVLVVLVLALLAHVSFLEQRDLANNWKDLYETEKRWREENREQLLLNLDKTIEDEERPNDSEGVH